MFSDRGKGAVAYWIVLIVEQSIAVFIIKGLAQFWYLRVLPGCSSRLLTLSRRKGGSRGGGGGVRAQAASTRQHPQIKVCK